MLVDGTGGLSVTEVFDRLDVASREIGLVDVLVRGEARGVRRRGRALTFELAETDRAGNVEGVLRCVVFGGDVPSVSRAGDFDGAEVLASGRFDVDAAWGSVRLVVSQVQVLDGRARRAEAADRLLERLTADGSLRAQHALVVPPRPVLVGLVSGAGTAGHEDFVEVLGAAPNEVRLVQRSAPMSGPRAPGAVAGAIGSLAGAGVEVIVVARGGGARSDLGWADSEAVVRAIVGCRVPVWTAIGHATDETLADVVANRSCPTPSAAAGALVERMQRWQEDHHAMRVSHDHAVAMTRLARSRRRALAMAVLALLVAVLVVLAVVAA